MVALRHSHIDLVIDIGANEGQFAKELRAGGYSGRIVSFEPLSAAHRRLLQESNRDSAWHVHPRCALGDRLGEIELNISGNSVSSSILPMLASHTTCGTRVSLSSDMSIGLRLITLDFGCAALSRGGSRHRSSKLIPRVTNGMSSKERVLHCQGYTESRWNYPWFRCTKVSASGGSALNAWKQ